jgi:hypothetical protein
METNAISSSFPIKSVDKNEKIVSKIMQKFLNGGLRMKMIIQKNSGLSKVLKIESVKEFLRGAGIERRIKPVGKAIENKVDQYYI